MAIEDRIHCPECGRAVVPQLWVDSRDRMRHPTVYHLCPLCGATLLASGGAHDRGALAFVIGIAILSLLLLFLLVMKYIS